MSSSDQVNILMVDDQPAKLLSYEAILNDLGEHLIRATSGREALEQLLKTDIAIVLMDVSMPEIDGFELAEIMRQHPRYQKTAIIFISGVHLTDLDRLKGYEVGAVDYLPVPVIPEILRAKVSVFAELYRKTRQLEELNQDLERRVEERTAALEQALQIRDNFVAVTAHELRTPVTALRMTAQHIMLRAQKNAEMFPEWLGERLRVIEHQSGRLTRLIEHLLDVSQLDQEKLAVERSLHDMVELMKTLIAGVQARSTTHAIVLTADAEVTAEIDPDAIEQVISNLLDNAIKYSPDGGQIDIELHAADSEHVSFAIRDRGLGIPPEKRAAIFERFYQAHLHDHRSGLGLGLYICDQIVKLHEGTIAAEFPADGGTRFVVTLPVRARAFERISQIK